MNDFAPYEWIGQLAVALACGGIVGFERETQRKAAGLRTNMLVSLGAAVYTLAVLEFTDTPLAGDWVRLDPSRMLAAIAGGIGFLGAGAIVQAGRRPHGLTSAAAIWVAGAVGMAAGLGYYAYALGVTVSTFVVLRVVSWVEKYFEPRKPDSRSNRDPQASDR